ncbi:MAG: class I SAM-dependent methyltransferase [Thermoanaerobacteraceae bacterium]|nr:class I SAM-dependent methyltransferase [Thermoanaerobacteraceae bacterium]
MKEIKGCCSVIDIGCGPGAFALKAAQNGMVVQAVDINKKNLDALNNKCREMCLENITTIFGNWLDIEVKKADVCISAYSFAGDIGTIDGIEKILQHSDKIAFFISPYEKIKTDFLSKDLYRKIGKTPPAFSGDYIDLLRIFSELEQPVKFEVIEHDFGMPLENDNEDTLEKCALYLCEKLELDMGSNLLELMREHLRNIITIKNGMYWVPNPRKSVMITWRRRQSE